MEQIVLGGAGCAGSSDCDDEGEIVLEVLTRAPEGRGRNLERELEGWTNADDGPCSLSELDSLKGIFEGKGRAEVRAKHFLYFWG